MKKLLLTTIFILTLNFHAFAKENANQPELTPTAKSAILIERDTGKVLYGKKENEKLPPASMTKIMTMLLIMEALERNELDYKDKIVTSDFASSMGGSQIFLEPGEEMTAEEMLYAIAVGSANDASVAMAETLAGSEGAFVVKMNKRANELGLKNTHFANCTGLPSKNHYSSAKDMATLAKELLKHQEITKFTGTYEKYLRENTDKKFWLVNTNRLVKFYTGADGLKTGFTEESKYCLTATADRKNMRLIAVVFGANTPKERNDQVKQMLDYGFTHYQTSQQFKKGEKLAMANVAKGSAKKVILEASDNVTLLLSKGESPKKLTPKVILKENISAPVKAGDILGKVIISEEGKTISQTDLIASETVESATWAEQFVRALSYFTQL